MYLLENLKNRLLSAINTLDSSDILKAIDFLSLIKGKIITTAIGKSQIAAQKLSATLNAVGIPAIVLDPNNALHGDIGVFCPDDVLIVFSKSGESQLLKDIINVLKDKGGRSLGIFMDANAPLQYFVDHALILPSVTELDDDNIIPTISVLVQIAISDIITLSLQSVRGLNLTDFGQNHPAGKIGMLHFTTIEQIVTSDSKAMVFLDDVVEECIIKISAFKKGCVAVVNKDFQVKGIITDGDLRRFFQRKMDLKSATLTDLWTPNPITVNKSELAAVALQIMIDKKISQVLVIDNNDSFLGVVHFHDLLR